MSEKRRSNRLYEEVLVRFEGENFSIYSRAKDLSEEGIFLATHYLLDPGTPISVFLPMEGGSERQRSARVIRTISKRSEGGEMMIGLGVEFTDSTPASA